MCSFSPGRWRPRFDRPAQRSNWCPTLTSVCFHLQVKEGPRSRTTRAYFTPEAFFEHCISLESTSGNQVDVVMTLQGGKSVRREVTPSFANRGQS